MGWLRRWLDSREALKAAQLARALAVVSPAPKHDPQATLEIFHVLDGLAKSRLELESAQMNHELKRLELEGALKLKEIQARDALREKRQRTSEELSAKMRAQHEKRGARLGGGVLPTFIRTCEDCRAWLDRRPPAHTRDMFNHASMRHQVQLEDLIAANKIARVKDDASVAS